MGHSRSTPGFVGPTEPRALLGRCVSIGPENALVIGIDTQQQTHIAGLAKNTAFPMATAVAGTKSKRQNRVRLW